jgi:hypothetical protein
MINLIKRSNSYLLGYSRPPKMALFIPWGGYLQVFKLNKLDARLRLSGQI